MGLVVLQTAQNLLKPFNLNILKKRLYENRENISVNFVTIVKNCYFNDKPSVAAHLCRNVSGCRTFRIVTTL